MHNYYIYVIIRVIIYLSLPELVVYFNNFTFLSVAAIQDGNGAFWDLKSSSKADFPSFIISNKEFTSFKRHCGGLGYRT